MHGNVTELIFILYMLEGRNTCVIKAQLLVDKIMIFPILKLANFEPSSLTIRKYIGLY